MAFPRAAALAEVAWSQPERLDWADFLRRLAVQFDRYTSLEMPFASSAFDVRLMVERVDPAGAAVRLSNQAGVGDIRYTIDGTDVTAESHRYVEALLLPAEVELRAATFLEERQLSPERRSRVGQAARRRTSRELTLCTEMLVLNLEDDAPIAGDRSVFLIDVMNPCWIWEDADLSGVTHIRAAVGDVPFNFQLGAGRDEIELRKPATSAGELEVRTGCEGDLLAVLPLRDAARNRGVTVLSQELSRRTTASTDLCFRFTADQLDPLWAIDWIELAPW
jgi:hexosaminidase